MLWTALAGVAAGLVTTVAGMGGGLMLLLFLAVVHDDPVHALVITSPALLLGNGHRLWRYRHDVDRGIAGPLIVGAVPTALLVGMVTADLPLSLIRWAMLGVALLAAARGLGLFTFVPPTSWGVPIGLTAGAVQATAGGSGVLFAPYLMARDLVGRPYVATIAAVAVALHVARFAGYGLGGLVQAHDLLVGTALAATIGVGNRLGEALSGRIDHGQQRRLQVAVLLGCALLGVVGAR
jgi:uncharacterized membrane protein YfcA